MGLASPETVELCHTLNEQGWTLPLDRLEPEDCARLLYETVKAGER